MKRIYLVILWIFFVLVSWILTAYILASSSVIAIPFQDIFLQLLTNFIVISSALIFGTIATLIVYFIEWLISRNRTDKS